MSNTLAATILTAFLLAFVPAAQAVPGFAIQTSQPCSSCHVNSFGGRLKQLGRDFKLYGYSSNDKKEHYIPFNVTLRGSFTHTDADIVGGPSDGFDVNDNFAFDSFGISYGGRIAENFGGIARLNYNGIRQTWAWGGMDLRYAKDIEMLGTETLIGVYINNGPSRSDLWENITGGLPGITSGLSRKPRGGFITNSLGGIVAGAGAYMMIDEQIYLEAAAYDGLNRDTLNALGVDPLNGSDEIKGLIPYGRATYAKTFGEDKHSISVGVMGLYAEVYPRGNETAGNNTYRDLAADVNYSYDFNPAVSTSDFITARFAYLNERSELDASQVLTKTKAINDFETFKADVSYSLDGTWAPSIHYFSNNGTKDAKRWGGNGNVDSRGWIAQLDYVPWGKPDSPVDWLNVRVSANYTAYEEFNGITATASDRNAFYLGITLVGTSAQ